MENQHSRSSNLTHPSFRRNDAVLHMESSIFANCAKIVASQLRGTVDRILIESTDAVIKNTTTTTCNGYESPQRGPPLP
ncbi:unnamed protein product [Prunus armeniaca]